MHTGYRPAANVRFPEIGAIVAKYLGQRGRRPAGLHQDFVATATPGSGFLGPKYQPFSIGHDGSLPPFSAARLEPASETRRHELRAFAGRHFARNEHQAETARMHREAYEAARRLQNARGVFKIDDEWAKYRRTCTATARSAAAACWPGELVEAGVPFVEVGQSSYDSHADNFTGTKAWCRRWNMPGPACSTDLEQRGLLDKTLVVWMGEIGRTPQHQQPRRPRPLRALLDHRPGRLRRERRAGVRRDRRGRRRREGQPGHRRRFLRHDLQAALGVRPDDRKLRRLAPDAARAVRFEGGRGRCWP